MWLVESTVKLNVSKNEPEAKVSVVAWTVGERVPRSKVLPGVWAWADPITPVAAITTSRFLSGFMFSPRRTSSELGVSSLAHLTPVAYQGIPADSSRKFIALLNRNASANATPD